MFINFDQFCCRPPPLGLSLLAEDQHEMTLDELERLRNRFRELVSERVNEVAGADFILVDVVNLDRGDMGGLVYSSRLSDRVRTLAKAPPVGQSLEVPDDEVTHICVEPGSR